MQPGQPRRSYQQSCLIQKTRNDPALIHAGRTFISLTLRVRREIPSPLSLSQQGGEAGAA